MYATSTVSGQSSRGCVPDYSGIDHSRFWHVDYLKCADGFPNGSTIKRLSLRRRPRAAVNNAEKPGVSTSQWYSEESLSSLDDARQLGMSSAARGRPPLPPPHGSPSDNKLPDSKPQPTARSLQRQSPVAETHRNVEQEVSIQPTPQTPPQPRPRRRLASFGGVSSPGSVSPFTGVGAYNQNNNGNRPTGSGSDMNLMSSLGPRGSTGSLKLSPQSSGRSTPVTALGSMHLQHVRDQMVVALQKLKELEEQVKVIPILQVKISVLQEEKRQLASQLKNQGSREDVNEDVWMRADVPEKANPEEGCRERNDSTALVEFRKLAEEMQALERTITGGNLQVRHFKGLSSQKRAPANRVETRCVATAVSEVDLGVYSEFDSQQLFISALKERISLLEAELKESALQTEMSRLKLELQAAAARNRADKSCLAQPSTASTGVQARPHTTSQGAGNHTEVRTAGVSCCGPELKTVSTGSDLPMSHWEVRERVETREKGEGIRVLTKTCGVMTEVKSCEAETNTEIPLETLGSVKGKTKYRSVACGDCSVDVILYDPKELVSVGVTTDPVKMAELGIMVSPPTASQRTNTVSSSVSRFTNTSHAFSTDSSTSTLLSTQDKHTNTAHTITRAVSVGNRVTDNKYYTETCTIGVGTGNAFKVTRDTGVGFTSIHENFLVGLKTRNMASGPSHLPDPIKTRSIGVGDGKIREFPAPCSKPPQSFQQSSQSQWDTELNHYIEKMQMLLGEHGDLLSEDFSPPCADRGDDSPVMSHNDKAHTGPEAHHSGSQPEVSRDLPSPSQLSVHASTCETPNPESCQQGEAEYDVKRMIQMLEQQHASVALQERSAHSAMLRPLKKKQNGQHGCSSTRRSMKLMRATTGLEPMPSYELPVSDRVNCDDVEKRGNKKLKEPPQVVARKGKGGSGGRGLKASARSHVQQRCKLNERMFSACQALKMHLSGDSAVSSWELQNCLQTLQQEWFSASSHKSATADTVDDYFTAFRVISPSVLQYVANMADGNGNTALHYSVSHSNFGIVKKLLDAEVCNVNQQNKAGYTPVMLAALAAVETAEDMMVVEHLLSQGDVNAKASQAGQTALMLAVSHGRMGLVRALLAQGSDVNIQDDEGSTALMCACEHGHTDIVKMLLAQDDCDATLTDGDESTALSIALEAGHHDIAMLLYAHSNFYKGQTGAAARHSAKSFTSSAGRNIFE